MDQKKSHNASRLGVTRKNKPPPQIRQTLASKYRLLKANPLLRWELEEKLVSKNPKESFVPLTTPLKTLVKLLDDGEPNVESSQTGKITQKPVSNPATITKTFHVENKQEKLNSGREVKNPVCNEKSNVFGNTTTRNTDFTIGNKRLLTQKHVLRKSLSFHVPETKKKNLNSGRKVENSICKEKTMNTSTLLNTPKKVECCPMTPSRETKEVTRRLSEWMRKRGKNLADFNHLKCFGVHLQTKNESQIADKENIETHIVRENSFDNKEEIKVVKNDDFATVAHDALTDLHKLILEGYPPEQCEIWLRLIKDKSTKVKDTPEYWECRAALEQTKGNIDLAVECYKTAIIQGAKVENVDKHLDQLLQKFSLLNIDNDFGNNQKSKVVENVRNIFKSSIIQFAVQERFIKTKNSDGDITLQKKLIATPVRRSTRCSRSAFTTTPKIQIYSSLQDIDSSIRCTLDFKCNNALRD
ncbi:uncharacterized protein LOC123004488 [Tribolium madens]|uniref:uncharacterized protein LOC123004488 n=1 Tax=Tribolium madens TaxID=41895 RepID=UPI001CF73B8B|nr:uncharacterized protein LOC123004488 [Tribolium madens]